MSRQAYGSGSMTEREPGVWRLRVMVDGKQRQETFRGTEAAARKHLRKMAPGDGGTDEASPVSDTRTFGDLLTKWLGHIEARGRAPKTIDENSREIESRIRPRLGHIGVSNLTAEDLDSAYSAWLDELSPSSVHRHAAVISAALTQGVKWGWLDTSPATRASSPPAAATREASDSNDRTGRQTHQSCTVGRPGHGRGRRTGLRDRSPAGRTCCAQVVRYRPRHRHGTNRAVVDTGGPNLDGERYQNQSGPDRGDRCSDHGPARAPSGLASQSVKSGPNRRSWQTPTYSATTRMERDQCSRQRSLTDSHRCETRSPCGRSDSTIYAMPTSPSSWRLGLIPPPSQPEQDMRALG